MQAQINVNPSVDLIRIIKSYVFVGHVCVTRHLGALVGDLLILLCCLISFTLIATARTRNGVNIQELCKQGLDFASIKEFRDFIQEFKQKPEEQLQQEKVSSKCIKQREAILALERLIVTERVCDSYQIDKLINYHNKYLKPRRRNAFAHTPITKRFFSKYAIQVAYTCKNNLIKNLQESRELLQGQNKSLEQAKEKVFKEQPNLRFNIKLIEEQPDAPSSTNVKPKGDIELTLGEYREALTRLKRPEDILTFERTECIKSASRRVLVAADEVALFFRPAVVCVNLARYYAGSVLSIARLANYGYTAMDDELDVKLADTPLVKDWVLATQVCEPMLFMRTEKNEDGLATIDTCSERVVSMENIVFDDNLSELDSERMGEWLKRSEATRQHAQKTMKSTMKKLARVKLMKQLNRGGTTKRQMFKIAFTTMSSGSSLRSDLLSNPHAKLTEQLMSRSAGVSAKGEHSKDGKAISPADEKSFEELIRTMSEDTDNEGMRHRSLSDYDNETDGPVSSFDPFTSLASTVTIIAIMLTFEWLFFVVMTLAARICHRLSFHFDNLLTFPPKILSWGDADFAHYSKALDKIDEDDFFDYDELTPDEQRQRDLLTKVFGKPPPMLFRE